MLQHSTYEAYRNRSFPRAVKLNKYYSLPGAEGEFTADDRDGQRRADQLADQVIRRVIGLMGVPELHLGDDLFDELQKILNQAFFHLADGDSRCRVL